ncbi:MAG TPA: hypothetical protein VK020_09440 [Microlunatus sp.]|nr:hypothetical protein [Microlunatus sp.]
MSAVPDRPAPRIRTVAVPAVADTAPPGRHAEIGPELDRRCAEVVRELAGGVERVGVRGLSLVDHPGWTAAGLAAEILRTGTDRHDPDRRFAFTAWYDELGVDLHLEPARVEPDGLRSLRHDRSVCGKLLHDFRVGPPADRGSPPIRIDLLSLYRLDRLEVVPVTYPDGSVDRLTAYRLGADPPAAVIGVVILARAVP